MKTTDLRHWMCRNACVDKNDGNGADWKCAWKMSMNTNFWIERSGCWPSECEYCPENPTNKKHRCWKRKCPCTKSKDFKSGCFHIDDDNNVTWCDIGVKTRMYDTIETKCRLSNCGTNTKDARVLDQVTGGCPMFVLRTKEEVATFLEMAWNSVGPKEWWEPWKVSGVFQRNGKISKF